MRIVARTSRGILSPRRALGFLARAHVSGSAAPLNLLGGCLDGGLAALFYFATPLDFVLIFVGLIVHATWAETRPALLERRKAQLGLMFLADGYINPYTLPASLAKRATLGMNRCIGEVD